MASLIFHFLTRAFALSSAIGGFSLIGSDIGVLLSGSIMGGLCLIALGVAIYAASVFSPKRAASAAKPSTS